MAGKHRMKRKFMHRGADEMAKKNARGRKPSRRGRKGGRY
jgi:hypothetical protein